MSDTARVTKAIFQHHQVRTKTVATVGPACSNPATLEQVARAGVDVFRINMAHGDLAFHDAMVDAIRDVSRSIGRPLGILADLGGPKIRLGELPGGVMQFANGDTVSFVRTATGEPCRLPRAERRRNPQPPGHQHSRRGAVGRILDRGG
jgi:pyruvate kinase